MSSKVIAIDFSGNRFVLWVEWNTNKVNIFQGLYELNRILYVLNATALSHLIVDTSTWKSIIIDKQMQTLGGNMGTESIARCPIEPVIENESFGAVLAAVPWITFHICDSF